MPLKLTGRARIFGLAGAATHSTMPANASWMPQGLEGTHDFEVKGFLYDPASQEPVGAALGREVRDLSLDIICVGAAADASQTVTEVAAGAALPAAPFKVTLSGFADAEMNATFVYWGGARKAFTPEGDMRVTLPLKKYLGLNDAAVDALIATVS